MLAQCRNQSGALPSITRRPSVSVKKRSVASKYAADFRRATAHPSLLYYGVSVGGWKTFFARRDYRFITVDANGVEVVVLGTRFDVQTDGDVTVVALAEGSVKALVEDGTEVLAPGDMLAANRATGEILRTTIPIADIATWRGGQIFVVNATIGSVVEQIRRYHPAWLSLPDGTLAGQRVTGFYDLRHPDQALEALVTPFGGKVRHVSPVARLISRL